MEFSLDRFYRLNRKAIIWVVLFALIYLLRDFFTLIFLTFIISFFAHPAARYLTERLRLNQRLSVVLVYLVIFVGYIALYVLVLPNVVRQAARFQKELPGFEVKLNELRVEYSEKYPDAAALLNFEVESSFLTPEDIDDWPAFLRQLNSDDPRSARVRRFLPEPLLANMARVSSAIDALAPEEAEAEGEAETRDEGESEASPAVESPPSPKTPDAMIEEELEIEVIDAVNSRVIANPSFFRSKDFALLIRNIQDYPEEYPVIERLLADQERLSPVETQKLNRLLLETAFPEIKRQQYGTERSLRETIDRWKTELQKEMPNFALYVLRFFGNSLLAILFSFLIVFDYARLSQEIKGLASSKLRDFFSEAGQPVVRFALSVGQGFQAIATIALITAAMVVVALVILGIPSVAFLAVVTFVTSLVPVVGIIFEVIPVVLVALNEHGAERALWALVALAIIHLIIGYVITPIIFGRRFKINLVAILFILYIGNQVAGVWGMILGVPIANYLLRDVLGVPEMAARENPPAAPDGPSAPRLDQQG